MENGAGSHIEIPEACSYYTHKTLLRHKQQQQMNEWMPDWLTHRRSDVTNPNAKAFEMYQEHEHE